MAGGKLEAPRSASGIVAAHLSPMVPSMKKPAGAKSPSELISARIAELDDWRGKTLAHVRKLIKAADPKVVEEWKWRGVPVWSDGGIICTGESYKAVVKLTFAKGAQAQGPEAPVQFEPRRQHAARHRPARRR